MSQRIKRELFSTQILQIFDACLVWCAFITADWLRGPLRDLFSFPHVEEDGIAQMIWVVYILVPLTPLLLDRLSFCLLYTSPSPRD